MECTVPVAVELATDYADVGSLERTISVALAEVGRSPVARAGRPGRSGFADAGRLPGLRLCRRRSAAAVAAAA